MGQELLPWPLPIPQFAKQSPPPRPSASSTGPACTWKSPLPAASGGAGSTASRQGASFGTYPDTSLADARERRDAARKLLAAGVDFGEHRKAAKAAGDAAAANSFEVVAREWFAKQETKWADNHSDKVIRRLERDIFPWVGKRPSHEATQVIDDDDAVVTRRGDDRILPSRRVQIRHDAIGLQVRRHKLQRARRPSLPCVATIRDSRSFKSAPGISPSRCNTCTGSPGRTWSISSAGELARIAQAVASDRG
jgi:hypothetical protein